VLLLDLYLNKRLADFESRLKEPVLQSGKGPEAIKKTTSSLITNACNKIYRRFRRRKRGRGYKQKPYLQAPTTTKQAASTIAEWAAQRRGRKLDTNQVVELAWESRWKQQQEGRSTTRLANNDPPTLLFTDKALKKHKGLTKAQSSLLT
jgi:hypothetical protein